MTVNTLSALAFPDVEFLFVDASRFSCLRGFLWCDLIPDGAIQDNYHGGEIVGWFFFRLLLHKLSYVAELIWGYTMGMGQSQSFRIIFKRSGSSPGHCGD